MKLRVNLQWNAPVSGAAYILENVHRKLWFYGITIGQIGIGFLISRKDNRI